MAFRTFVSGKLPTRNPGLAMRFCESASLRLIPPTPFWRRDNTPRGRHCLMFLGATALGIGAAVAIDLVKITDQALVSPNVLLTVTGLSVTAGMTPPASGPGTSTNTLVADATAGNGGGKFGIAGSLRIRLRQHADIAWRQGQAEATADLRRRLALNGSITSRQIEHIMKFEQCRSQLQRCEIFEPLIAEQTRRRIAA